VCVCVCVCVCYAGYDADAAQLLTVSECLSNPCRNGAACVDQYNGFLCQCAPGWQGSLCDLDVNECSTLAGTDLGCQNGATCLNTPGSFRYVYSISICTALFHARKCGSKKRIQKQNLTELK